MIFQSAINGASFNDKQDFHMKIYSQLEKEIIRGLIGLHDKKGTFSLRDLFNPSEIPSRLPSLSKTGRWAIDSLNKKLEVRVPDECYTSGNHGEMDMICSTTRKVVCVIAILIDSLREEKMIVSNPRSDVEDGKIWLGTFEPDAASKHPPIQGFLDGISSDIKESFLKNTWHLIDYVSDALKELAADNFQPKETIAARDMIKTASDTAEATKKIVWFTLIGPVAGAIAAFFLPKLQCLIGYIIKYIIKAAQ
jgi:hypothetical protein